LIWAAFLKRKVTWNMPQHNIARLCVSMWTMQLDMTAWRGCWPRAIA
jgi:hypothetical protein